MLLAADAAADAARMVGGVVLEGALFFRLFIFFQSPNLGRCNFFSHVRCVLILCVQTMYEYGWLIVSGFSSLVAPRAPLQRRRPDEVKKDFATSGAEYVEPTTATQGRQSSRRTSDVFNGAGRVVLVVLVPCAVIALAVVIRISKRRESLYLAGRIGSVEIV